MDVKITDLSLTYGDFTAVEHLSLHIEDGESLVLLGQSGCGKTSTMRCVAGLEDPSGGSISIGGTTVFDAAAGTNVAPNRRNVGLVFQSYAVWPHMTVLENVSFPLRMKRRPKKEIRTRAQETLELVGLGHLADKGASKLSGGQMQRVALARSLAMEPNVMLLDEPLSNLDARLRDDLRVELRRLQLELGLTSIYVTHDQSEALALADRIAIMQHGRISQLATPVETYRNPASASIAEFLGVANIFRTCAPRAGEHRLRLADHALEIAVGTAVPAGDDLSVCVRPEHVRLATQPGAGAPNSWPGTVEVSVFQGSYARCTVALDAGPSLEVHTQDATFVPRQHDRVHVEIDPAHVQVLPQEVGPVVGDGVRDDAAPAEPGVDDDHGRRVVAHAATMSGEG
ncbi:iron(III) transport system ATP-binding protein [Pseudonocardia ammonioxydans]|uniref:Iron(III) transport system ATP-binding protein n=1 Tax=Pseudonocardia ammonioxydans TaxID=260086 RepID=A0A1I5ARN0_PSUAM|nr:ABC transporter ATP-binding protein [Pseudonocardia ammonioxydans]SFN64859.1 iron(III) transport system ATP-binding protein [Pseudonocardia ammonioxydans]